MAVLLLARDHIIDIHEEMLDRYGGLAGVRDDNALNSAIQRPDDKGYYEPDSSLSELAASLAYGLAKNHAFNDANKRTSLAATHVFLNINGFQIEENAQTLVETWVALASDGLSEAELAIWIEARLVPFETAPERETV